MGGSAYRSDSSDGNKVGEVIDVNHDPATRVTEAYVDTGMFLGMGATQFRVTSDQIEEETPNGLVLTLKEFEVKSLPPAGESQKP